MAFTGRGNVASGQSKASSTSVTTGAWLTGSPNVNIGDLLIVVVAKDNSGTIDADNNEVTSVTDTVGNTYTKLGERTNGQGSAGAGCTVAVWYTIVTADPTTSDSWTANFASAVTAKTITVYCFGLGTSAVAVVGNIDARWDDGADAGSMTPSAAPLPNAHHLYLRAIAHEGANGDAFTQTSTWSPFPGDTAGAGTTGGGGATNMSVRGEFKIATSTTETSDPTYTSADHISLLIVLKEATTASTAPVPRVVIPNKNVGPAVLRYLFRRQPVPVTRAGAQVFQVAVDGSTGSSGALAKRVDKNTLGGSSSSDGALTKRVDKALAGSSSSSGAIAKVIQLVRGGTTSSSGALQKVIQKILAGTTSSSGALAFVKVIVLTLAGTSSSTGALTKVVQLVRGGTTSSSGALVKRVDKSVGGTSASSGALTKLIQKLLAGTTASSGVIAFVKTILLSLGGTSASSGSLTKRIDKGVAGSTASSGALTKQVQLARGGTTSSAGAIAKVVELARGGTTASSGVLGKVLQKLLAGVTASAGALTWLRIGGASQARGTLALAEELVGSLALEEAATGSLAVSEELVGTVAYAEIATGSLALSDATAGSLTLTEGLVD